MSSFIDTASLSLKAGDGGPGSISFRREKYIAKGGPDGGDGGNGGSIVLKTSSNLYSLTEFHISNKIYKAENGKPGSPKKMHGASGKDLVIPVPIGSLIYDESHSILADLSQPNQTFVIAKGGKGGKGNTHFSTSVKQSPYYAQKGLKGDEIAIHIELRLIAEVGLIGLPNAGKSSLLKCITNANVRIADYPFTTLFPNLGTLKTHDKEVIIADIPGLIKGASKGKGLGDGFLRHIDRTKCLVHLIAAESSPEECWKNYLLTCNELEQSQYNLLSKQILVIITKSDLISPDLQKEIIDYFYSKNIQTFTISSFTNNGISRLIDHIIQLKLSS